MEAGTEGERKETWDGGRDGDRESKKGRERGVTSEREEEERKGGRNGSRKKEFLL